MTLLERRKNITDSTGSIESKVESVYINNIQNNITVRSEVSFTYVFDQRICMFLPLEKLGNENFNNFCSKID